jgi:SAM-dependent methyltransferase
VFCQLGLQFFPDRPAALSEMRRVLAPNGRFGASVFSSIDRNPAADALASSLDRHFGEGASRAKRHEHALGERAEFSALLAGTGFAPARVVTIRRAVRFASAEEWVRIQFLATPLAKLLEGRQPGERERLIARVGADIRATFAQLANRAGLAFPQEVHIAVVTGDHR